MPRNPKQQRSKATVDAIVRAGFICVAENGLAATTTRQIAKKAGVGIGSIYEYFSDKDAIYEAMEQVFTEDVTNLIVEITPALTDQTIENVLRNLLGHFRQFLLQDDGVYLRYAQQVTNTHFEESQRSVNKVLIELLMQYALKHPELAKVTNIPGVTYFLMYGGAYAVMSLLLDPSPNLSFDELVDAIAMMASSYAEKQLEEA